jgi:DNA ligase (NAD+)
MAITFESIAAMPAEKLAELVRYHNTLYWEKGEPEIGDELYDAVVRELAKKDPSNPLLEEVAAPRVEGGGKVRHSKPMLSLDKAYSFEELLEWARKHARNQDEPLLIQPKYDGISAVCLNGVLATRGDGAEGEDISAKACLVELETKGFKGPFDGRDVRGEIVIREDDFKTIWPGIKKKDGGVYKNSRNAVAGIMGLKDISAMRAQGAKLTLVDYDLVSYKLKLAELKDEWPRIVKEIEELPYPLDGIVVKLADSAYSESLGSTAHHPRGQIAFKFSGVRRRTKLLSVEWSFGKKFLTPVANLDPVEIGGVTVKRASLHNAQNIEDKGVFTGDYVIVERAGDVIPYIVSAEPGEDRKPCLITKCPCCGTELKREGPELLCPNPECFETNLQKLLAAVKGIGIERLGEPNIRKMMNVLDVKTPGDIFKLTKEDILKLDGFKDKSASNLYNEIQTARKVRDYDLLASLNIPAVGPNVAKVILEKHSLAELRALDPAKLPEIGGIGPERAKALDTELKRQSAFLDSLLPLVELVQTKGSEAAKHRPTICFTGKMPEKRSYYESIAAGRGFAAADSVTAELSLLVCADPAEQSSKLLKARKLGVKILTLDQWLEEMKNAPQSPESPEPPPAPAKEPEKQPGQDSGGFADLPLFNSLE